MTMKKQVAEHQENRRHRILYQAAIILLCATLPLLLAITPTGVAPQATSETPAPALTARELSTSPAPSTAQAAPTEELKARAQAAFSRLTPTFVRNAGQLPDGVQYAARGLGHGTYFMDQEVRLVSTEVFRPDEPAETMGRASSLDIPKRVEAEPRPGVGHRRGIMLALRFPGASPNVKPEGRSKDKARMSYFRGNDPAKWQRNVPAYREVVYKGPLAGRGSRLPGRQGASQV